MTAEPSISRSSNALILSLANGFEVQLKLADGYVLGIGSVQYRGHDLRNPAYTIRPALKSIDGLSFDSFRLLEANRVANGVRVVTECLPTQSAETEWQDLFNHEFVTMPAPDGFAGVAKLVWEIGETEEEIYGKIVPGFTYRFRLESEAEFHCHIEQGTWEIDSLSRPVTVIAQRAGSLPWESEVGEESRLYTHESIDYGKEHNSRIQVREGLSTPDETIVWQMMPRGAGSQTFDFQATSDGWTAVYHPVPGYIQACLRKESDDPVIAHLERHYFPRRQGVDSGIKVVLAHFPESGLSIEQIRDDWSDVYDTVNGLWRAHFNYPEDESDTAYSPTLWNGALEEEPTGYRRVIDMIPALAKLGVRRLFPGPWWKSHFSENLSDECLCHVMEYEKCEKQGGTALLKEMCDTAHRHGMEVYIWCLGTVSRFSPIPREHPDWICIDRNSNPTASIPHPGLYCMDYNTGWADFFAERMLAIKEQCGIDGLFIDSYHNLNFQPINYADPELRTNVPALIAWQRRMREAGLELMIESHGVFGTSLNWLDRGYRKTEANAGVEHTFYKTMVVIPTESIESGLIDESFCYRATANKAPLRTATDFNAANEIALPTGAWERFLARINHDYQALSDRMIRRRTLPGDRGVEWLNEDRSRVLALYSFADFDYTPPDGLQLCDVTEGCEVNVMNGKAGVRKFHSYRLDSRAPEY